MQATSARSRRRPWRAATALLVLAVLAGCSTAGSDAPGPVTADPPAPTEPDEPDPRPDEPDEPDEPPPPDPPAGFTAPVRAAWVHLFDDTLTDRASIDAMIAELRTAGIDTLIAQPVRRHDAYYGSEVLPRTPDPAVADGIDVLAELLDAAHAADIAVHAWLSVAPTEHAVYDDLPDPPGWIATTRGRAAPEAERWVTRADDGTWSEYLDIALPAVHDHVVAVTTEIAARYPVDGIHLDYVRYPSERHGYHPQALDRYRDASGTTGTPDADDPAFVAWRQDRGTELVAAVRAGLDDLDRQVPLSAAVVTWGDGPGGASTPTFADTRTAREALQDWPTWVEQGLVDAVLPMNYFRAHEPDQADWFERWLAFEATLAAEHETAVVPGIGAWLNAPDAVIDQSRQAVAATDGAAIYSVQQPSDDDDRGVWQRLAEEAWPAGD